MSTSAGESKPTSGPPLWIGPGSIAALGSLLLVAAQPPLSWHLLAWIAPLPWLQLATRPTLGGRRTYFEIWAAGFLYWALAVHWIRLAHPATFLGLLLLAAYFGLYLVLFIKLTHVGVVQWGLPGWLVAPVVWVATEWLEGHLLGGFLMGTLGHTQIHQSQLIQIADIGGGYLVSALVMLVAAALGEAAQIVSSRRGRLPAWRAVLAVLVATTAIASSYWYGQSRLVALQPSADAPTRTLALVQGSERAVWTSDPGRDQRVMQKYMSLSDDAVQLAQDKQAPIDLMVWPEGMFRTLLYDFDPALAETADTSQAEQYASYAPNDLARTVEAMGTALLVGIDRYYVTRGGELGSGRVYNAAVAVDRTGRMLGTYDKTHLVMFGEYVPGGSLWPGIYRFFPIGGVTPGDGPAAFEIDGIQYMPTICYETVIPHVVRRQVVELAGRGSRPDVLVNLTNDSWFNDSSELAMHLTCSRLRAIECRTPLVVAANGGLSANVDRCGRLLDVSQAMTEQVLLVEVIPGGSDSIYLQYGDTFAIGCLLGTVLLAVGGLVRRSPTALPAESQP